MKGYVIFCYSEKDPDVLWSYVVDEDPKTWVTREKGDGWILQGSVEIKDQTQRRWFERWDGTATRRVNPR
jgi:hypothetical protein